jgi:hypothetical protein
LSSVVATFLFGFVTFAIVLLVFVVRTGFEPASFQSQRYHILSWSRTNFKPPDYFARLSEPSIILDK